MSTSIVDFRSSIFNVISRHGRKPAPMTKVLILAVVLGLVFSGLAVAQLPKEPGPPVGSDTQAEKLPAPLAERQTPKEVPAPPSPAPPRRDPTKPGQEIRKVLEAKPTGPTQRAAVPLALRARVIARDKPPAAILEIEGKLYTVAKGSVLAGPGNMLMRVIELDSNEVRIEVGPNKEVLTLR